MARIRSIHPGWFTDEAWVSVSFEARLLGIGLWTECDDQGVFEWKPITIKMRLFPADNLDIGALLAELATVDLIRQFEVGGKKYGAVRNFCRFQRPKKPRPVHPMPAEFRTYVGSDAPSGELDDPEDGSGGEPGDVEAPPVPQKAEKPKQMEGEEEKEREGRGKGKGASGARELRDEITRIFVEVAPNRIPPDTNRAVVWLAQGYEPELILSVVREVLARKPDVGSLTYFDRRLAEARDGVKPGGSSSRGGSRREPEAPTPLPSPAEVRRHQLGMATDFYRGRWHPNWPTTLKPDHPDCVIPEDVLGEARAIIDTERAMSPAERAEARGFAMARH